MAFASRIDTPKRQLAGAIALASSMHLLAGRFGWVKRCEIYIWTVTALTMIYVSGEALSARLSQNSSTLSTSMAALVTLMTCEPYSTD